MMYYAPKTHDEITGLLEKLIDEKTILLAGGTDAIAKRNSRSGSGWITPDNVGCSQEEHMIYLGNLELDYISQEGNEIRIGACTTLSDVLYSPIIEKNASALKSAISEIAGISIRNIATIGGNIMNASPAADTVPVLMVYDAKLILTGADGDRVVGITDFFTGPGETVCKKGEYLKEVRFPICTGNSKFLKYGRRKAETLSVVNGAAYAIIEDGKFKDIRLAVGAVAPIPLRLKKIEDMLKGKVVSDELLETVLKKTDEMIAPIDDKRSTASYRGSLTKVLIKRLLREVCK